MSGRIQLLGAAFVVQLLLVAGFFYLDAAGSSAAPPSFLELAPADVSRIVISGEGETIEMSKDESGWRLAGDTPADGDKIDEVLEKLSGLSAPWPVATSESSRERFEVTADSNQRRVQMFGAEETIGELFLGTSPGYRRVHARAGGADEVYSIDFSTFELPVGRDDWLDKDLLRPLGEVTEVVRDGAWSLSRGEEGWLLGAVAPAQNAGEQGAADPDAADRLIERVADLRVTGFAGDAQLTEQAAYTVTDDAGIHRLRIFHDEEEDTYAVESDRIEGRFAVAAYIAEQLLVADDELRASPSQEDDVSDVDGSSGEANDFEQPESPG
ncbi:MAG: DUF4340 domain-containing protein [Gammaproteobacteria bacterium]|nr:DUF4340 domain-containing protein [Gammaproteobacteria bacterium]